MYLATGDGDGIQSIYPTPATIGVLKSTTEVIHGMPQDWLILCQQQEQTIIQLMNY